MCAKYIKSDKGQRSRVRFDEYLGVKVKEFRNDLLGVRDSEDDFQNSDSRDWWFHQ